MQIQRPLRASTALLLCGVLLGGCVSPRVVHVYDEKCKVMTRKMELTVEKVQALDACSNHECVAQVLGEALTFATTAVVSGSVALVGNVAFWLEKSANCKPNRAPPSGTTQVPPAAAASAAKS